MRVNDPIVILGGAGLLVGLGAMAASRWTQYAQLALKGGAGLALVGGVTLVGRVVVLNREEPKKDDPPFLDPNKPPPPPQFPTLEEREAYNDAWNEACQDLTRRVRPQQSTWGFLMGEYKARQNPTEEMARLVAEYPQARPIRGDGNCFYSSFAVAYLTAVMEEGLKCDPALEKVVDPFQHGDSEAHLQNDALMTPFIKALRELTAEALDGHEQLKVVALGYGCTPEKYIEQYVLKMGEEAEEMMYGPLANRLGCGFSLLRKQGETYAVSHFNRYALPRLGEAEVERTLYYAFFAHYTDQVRSGGSCDPALQKAFAPFLQGGWADAWDRSNELDAAIDTLKELVSGSGDALYEALAQRLGCEVPHLKSAEDRLFAAFLRSYASAVRRKEIECDPRLTTLAPFLNSDYDIALQNPMHVQPAVEELRKLGSTIQELAIELKCCLPLKRGDQTEEINLRSPPQLGLTLLFKPGHYAVAYSR